MHHRGRVWHERWPPANLMAQYITLNEVAILSLFCCLSPVIYDGIILLCPLFISALTKWMKQLSSLSAWAAEMWELDFCRWKALAGDQNQWWNVLRNFFCPLPFSLWRWAPQDGLCIPLSSVSPISLWQEVISGEGAAADRTQLGILHLVLFEHLIFVFAFTPRPSSFYHTFILHPTAWMEHEFFCIIKHTLHAFILIQGYSFIHYSIKIYWVPPRY